METKKRKPVGAALLSILVPGLGQFYNGQPKKGLLFYFIVFLLPVVISLTNLQYSFFGMMNFILLGIALYLIIAGEAFITAKKINVMTLKAYNRWYYFLLVIILSFGINSASEDIIKRELLGIKAYKIPSGAMIPTLLIGDHIIVNLNAYRNDVPQKGDIIVFKYPEDPSREFIKRIVATEDDILESKDKIIHINGTPINETFVQHVDKIIKYGGNDPRDNFGPFTIPKGKVFVIGDNRDQSYDSRYWGYVDNNQITGKALYLYWSQHRNRIGKEINNKQRTTQLSSRPGITAFLLSTFSLFPGG
jgi:signal peptidase I